MTPGRMGPRGALLLFLAVAALAVVPLPLVNAVLAAVAAAQCAYVARSIRRAVPR